MGKKLLITEEEKFRILDLYGVLKNKLNEATTTTLNPITVQLNFDSGCHSNTGGEKCASNQITNAFSSYIEQIKTFLKSAPTNEVVEVVLSASESKVPNRDGEKPKGSDGKRPKLSEKELSKKRYSAIEEYLKGVFNTMLSSKEISKIPEFKQKEVLVGGPAWDPNKGADNQEYKKHQYLKAVIKLKGSADFSSLTPDTAKKECIQGIKIEYNYDEVVEAYEGHCCKRGRFNIFANGVQLKRSDGKTFASINNSPGNEGTADLQKDARSQISAIGYRKTKDGTNDICYTSKNQKNVDASGKDLYNTSSESKPGNYRYNTFLISADEANKIVTTTKGEPGLLTITAAPTSDNTNPHKEAVRMTIYRPDGTLAYDSCEGGACEGGAYGPWKINFCSTSTPSV